MPEDRWTEVMLRLDRNEQAMHEYARKVTEYIGKVASLQETLAAIVARTETEAKFFHDRFERLDALELRLREVEQRIVTNTVIANVVSFIGGALLVTAFGFIRKVLENLI